MSDLGALLEGFTRLEGVLGALLLRGDGVPAAACLPEGREPGPLAAAMTGSLQAGSSLYSTLGLGTLSQQHLQYGAEQVAVELLAGGAALGVLATQGANLGRLRLEIRKQRAALEERLERSP